MKNRKFQYVETSAKLFSRFHSYTSEDCVVCRNEQLKSALEMQCYSKSILESRPKILSLEEFFSCICSTEKIILKDLHRVFALYQVLTEEQKKRWKIRGYFDFVDIANDFFSFYQECYELTERIEEEILPWQREKFLFFQEMKSAFDIKMERENSLPKDWLFPIKYYSSQFLK